MVGVNCCRICKKSPRVKYLGHILDGGVKVGAQNDEIISFFEAMQQLTGIELDYDAGGSHKICVDCQHKVKFAYRIRREICEAFEPEDIKSVEVYEIIAGENDELNCVPAKQENVEEELVEVAELDSYDIEHITPDEHSETVYVEDEINVNEESEENGDDDDIDAVSFLLEKEELFKEDPNKAKRQKRAHKCDVCEKTFMRKSNLVDHLRLHANVRMYKCQYCDKEFVQAGNHRSHLRIHTKERPYKCALCPKTYNQSSALKVHIRSHTNERNYVCETCNKAFTNSSDLNKHKRVHDPDSKIKCDHCPKTFAQRVNLKNHLMRHHGKKTQK